MATELCTWSSTWKQSPLGDPRLQTSATSCIQGSRRSSKTWPVSNWQKKEHSGAFRTFSLPLTPRAIKRTNYTVLQPLAACSNESSPSPLSREELSLTLLPFQTKGTSRSVVKTPRWLVSSGLLLLVLLPLFGLLSPAAFASIPSDSIAALSFGQKVASFLRSSGFPDEVIVFLMAMLPVLELRGSIPVGYWMKLDPLRASFLAILGNMVPVPLILLFLKPISQLAAKNSNLLRKLLLFIFHMTRKKAGPIAEFKWLGLMLFVAVPLPGTGAWSGAIAAFILEMPFWSAFSANFVGVALAGIIMNIVCQLGLRSAVGFGLVLFLVSTFIWSFLRWFSRVSQEKKVES